MSNPPEGLSASYSTALVTGASSGIGRAVARQLHRAGLTVYGTTRDPDREGLDPDIRWLALEGATQDGWKGFARDNEHLLIKLDILVNNAGSSLYGRLEALPEEGPPEQFRLLLETPVGLVRAVLPGMRQRGRGAIVNVSSLAAVFPLPYMSTYSAGKAGLSGFTQSLILSEKGSGLVIIDFQPGDYRTAFNENMQAHGELSGATGRAWRRMEENLQAAPLPEKAAEDLVRRIAGGRSGTYRSGDFFQAVLAPMGIRLLPGRILLWAIGRYYQLGGK